MPALGGCAFEPATIAPLQALIERDALTWALLEGAPPRPDEAQFVMTDRPPGVPLARKHVWLADHCVLDVLEGFPTETTWYLGLIFIAPEARNTGLGRRVLEDLVAYARERGAAALRLAVAVENTAARRLYDRLGFAHVARRARQTWTGLTQQVDVLERAITSPA